MRFGLGILGLAAAGTAAAILAFASGGTAASSKSCVQLSTSPPQANCLFTAIVPNVLSANKTGLLVVRFKNIFANATATHTVLAATMPSGTSVVENGVTASTPGATCSQTALSCSFGSVPGGSIVSMYIQFTTSLTPPAQLDPAQGFVSFDESNGNTGTTTNDSFETDSGTTPVVANIAGGTAGEQGGLCTGDLTQTGFTTTNNGQQAKIANLPAGAPGLPCTPVSAGVRIPTAEELQACGSACPANTAFVFFPVLANNAAAILTLNYPTLPPGVSSFKKTPLFEFLPDKNGVLTLVQLVKCGVKPNPSPDSCIVGDPQKFGSSGVSFTVSVTGSDLDGRLTP